MKRKTDLSLGKIRKKTYQNPKEIVIENASYLFEMVKVLSEAKTTDKPIAVVGIGTPKILGDSIGPLVGSLLESMDLPIKVLGTVSNPVHALNIQEQIDSLKNKYTVIVIDAAIGKKVGEISCEKGGIYPGAGTKKDLGYYGDYSILVTTATNRIAFYTLREEKFDFIKQKVKLIAYCIKVMFDR